MKTVRIQNIIIKYPKKLEEFSTNMLFGANTIKKQHKIEDGLVFSVSELKNKNFLVSVRKKGVISRIANFLGINKLEEAIPRKDFEHETNWPMSDAFEMLYLRFKAIKTRQHTFGDVILCSHKLPPRIG